jgi:hypothetical protein
MEDTMAYLSAEQGGERRRRHSSDERQFKLLVALTFPIFFIAVLTTTLIGKRPAAQVGARLSIFAEAKSAASTAIAIGFMG